jgi:hypothetical protein
MSIINESASNSLAPKTSSVGRVSVSLTGPAAGGVRELAEKLGLSEGDVVRRALGILRLVVDEEEAGSKIVFQTKSGQYESVRWVPVY